MTELTWAERELVKIVRIVSQWQTGDQIEGVIILSAIRRLMESEPDKYLDLVNWASLEAK